MHGCVVRVFICANACIAYAGVRPCAAMVHVFGLEVILRCDEVTRQQLSRKPAEPLARSGQSAPQLEER